MCTICQTLRGVTMKKCGGDEIRRQDGNDADLGIHVCHMYDVFVQALRMPRSKNTLGVYRPSHSCDHGKSVVGTKWEAKLEMMPTWKYMFCYMIFSLEALYIYMPRFKNSLGVYHLKCKIFRTSRLSCLGHVPAPGQVRSGYGKARGVWAAPHRRRSNEAIWPRILVPRIAYWSWDGKKSWPNTPPKEWSYVYLYSFKLFMYANVVRNAWEPRPKNDMLTILRWVSPILPKRSWPCTHGSGRARALEQPLEHSTRTTRFDREIRGLRISYRGGDKTNILAIFLPCQIRTPFYVYGYVKAVSLPNWWFWELPEVRAVLQGPAPRPRTVRFCYSLTVLQ